jgi:hypothetical protein
LSNHTNHPTTWTAAQLAALVSMRRANRPNPEIAKAIGKTKGAVAGKISRLALPLVAIQNAHNVPRPRGGKYH